MTDATPGSSGKQDLVGRVLDERYRVDRLLGSGGVASVYLAEDVRLRRKVVVKVPPARILEQQGFGERFEGEIAKLISLHHPHIVKALDVGSLARSGRLAPIPYVVLEYLAGGNLRDRLALTGGRQSRAEVAAWLLPVAQALDYIHREGVVHRDVKPGNVLFDEDGNVFLAGFIIAKALGALDAAGPTRTDATSGSSAYAAPEAAAGSAAGPAYDQYSLAVLVFEALSGSLPREAAKPSSEAWPLSSQAADVTAEAASAVHRALERDPEKRFPTCVAFAEAFAQGLTLPADGGAPLARVVARSPAPAAEPRPAAPSPPAPPARPIEAAVPSRKPPPPPAGKRPAFRRLWIFLLLAAAASLSLLVVVLLTRHGSEEAGVSSAEPLSRWINALEIAQALKPKERLDLLDRLRPVAGDARATKANLDQVEKTLRGKVGEALAACAGAFADWDASFGAVGPDERGVRLRARAEEAWEQLQAVLPRMGDSGLESDLLGPDLQRRIQGLGPVRSRVRIRILAPSDRDILSHGPLLVRGEVDGLPEIDSLTANDKVVAVKGRTFECSLGLPLDGGALTVKFEVPGRKNSEPVVVTYKVDGTPPIIDILDPPQELTRIDQPNFTISGVVREANLDSLTGPDGRPLKIGPGGTFIYKGSVEGEAIETFFFNAIDLAKWTATAQRKFLYTPRWRNALERAVAADAAGDRRAAAAALDEAVKLQVPAIDVPRELRLRVESWSRPARLEILEPADGIAFESDEVAVAGRLQSERSSDEVFVNGEPVALAKDGAFRTIVKRGRDPTLSILVEARDGAETRASETRHVTLYSPSPGTYVDASPNSVESSPEQYEFSTANGIPVTIENRWGMRFRLLPPAAGTNSKATSVTYLQMAEMTRGQYEKVNLGLRTLELPKGQADPPVTSVSEREIAASITLMELHRSEEESIRWVRYRLPTSEEWERAAGKASTPAYWSAPNGDKAATLSNLADSSVEGKWAEPLLALVKSGQIRLFPSSDLHADLTQEGAYPPNASGFYDLIGNAWEWTSTKGTAGFVIRGGSWKTGLEAIATVFRSERAGDAREDDLGFRLAVDVDVLDLKKQVAKRRSK